MKGKSTLFNALMGLQDSRSLRGIFSRGKNVYQGSAPQATTGNRAAILRSGMQPFKAATSNPNFKREYQARRGMAKMLNPGVANQPVSGGSVPPMAGNTGLRNVVQSAIQRRLAGGSK